MESDYENVFLLLSVIPVSKKTIFATHKQSCGKVMLSQAFVVLFREGICTLYASWDRSNSGVPPPLPLDIRPGYLPPLLTSGGYHWRPVQTCSLEALPWGTLVLTSIGGHRVGGKHPTVIKLSLVFINGVLLSFSFGNDILHIHVRFVCALDRCE